MKDLKATKIVNIVAILIVAILQIVIITMPVEPFIKINAGVGIVALAFGLFYTIKDYSKSVALYYKLFMFLFAINELLSVIGMMSDFKTGAPMETVIKILLIVIFIAVLVLAFTKDLGKKTSVTISTAIFAFYLLVAILAILNMDTESYKGIAYIFLALQKVVLSALASVFVKAKYEDKEERGTK